VLSCVVPSAARATSASTAELCDLGLVNTISGTEPDGAYAVGSQLPQKPRVIRGMLRGVPASSMVCET
jgi:hypothetical protein